MLTTKMTGQFTDTSVSGISPPAKTLQYNLCCNWIKHLVFLPLHFVHASSDCSKAESFERATTLRWKA